LIFLVNEISPLVGLTTQSNNFNNVDLPLPFSPTTPIKSPLLITRFKLYRISDELS
jgi:hypothetical protein